MSGNSLFPLIGPLRGPAHLPVVGIVQISARRHSGRLKTTRVAAGRSPAAKETLVLNTNLVVNVWPPSVSGNILKTARRVLYVEVRLCNRRCRLLARQGNHCGVDREHPEGPPPHRLPAEARPVPERRPRDDESLPARRGLRDRRRRR